MSSTVSVAGSTASSSSSARPEGAVVTTVAKEPEANLPPLRKSKLPLLRLSQQIRRRRADSFGDSAAAAAAAAASLPPTTPPKSTPTKPKSLHRRRWSFPKNHLFQQQHKKDSASPTTVPSSSQDDSAIPSTRLNTEHSAQQLNDPIVTKYEAISTPTTANNSSNNSKEEGDDHIVVASALAPTRNNQATAILQHSYLEYVCGCGNNQQPKSWDLDVDGGDDDTEEHEALVKQQHERLSEDPTVQESIECVFASQLQEGLPQALWDEDDDNDQQNNSGTTKPLPLSTNPSVLGTRASLLSPASLLQSRASSRSTLLPTATSPTTVSPSRVNSICSGSVNIATANNNQKKSYQTASLVHMGTLDPNHEPASPESKNHVNADIPPESDPASPATDIADAATTTSAPTFLCPCCSKGRHTPWIEPNEWPQLPLLLKPSPNSGTRIIGVRYSCDEPGTKYLWKPTDTVLWNQPLLQDWGRVPPPEDKDTAKAEKSTLAAPRWCENCCILPINNGNEENGKSLLVDFESEYFVGSLLLRLRHVEGTTPQPYDDTVGYFYGMNRRYQAVVQGRFKQPLSWANLVTGFQLERPCGKLPPKWILKSALKVVSFFAPQLEAKFDVDKPSSLTPLGSTPQVINIHDEPSDEKKREIADPYEYREDIPPPLDIAHVEPTNPKYTLLGQASDASTSFQRSRCRKRAFDKLYVQHQHYQQHLASPSHHQHHPPPQQVVTDPDKVYSMEFLQHLFNFQDFSMELGSMLGSVKLKEILDGQPIQFMACISSHDKEDDGEEEERRRRQRLWSFDIWHASLMEDAKKHDPAV